MKKSFLFCFTLLSSLVSFTQNHGELIHFYPDKTPWPLTINVVVHVIQYTENDPRNFVPADSNEIHTIFNTVNQIYNNLEQPTLVKENVPFFRESKIQFAIQGIYYHIDSTLWKTEWLEPDGFVKVHSADPKNGLLVIKGNQSRNYSNKKEDLFLKYNSGKGVKLERDTVYFMNGMTYVKTKNNIDTNGINSLGKIVVKNTNCSMASFDKYARNIPHALNVFLTQSTVTKIIFGCGPSKNFLNLTNTYKGNYWVAGQLMAHEVGHCLGLSHTNSPQFPDLPSSDKFGWLNCDSSEVSNNIMGYNICRNYLSPMQIASVHRLFNIREDYISITRNKHYDPSHIFDVWYNQDLERSIVLNGDIIIRRNKTLTIKRFVKITPETKIILEEGAKIIVDGGSLSVLGDAKNANVIYCKRLNSTKKYKRKGEIKTLNNGKITGLSF